VVWYGGGLGLGGKAEGEKIRWRGDGKEMERGGGGGGKKKEGEEEGGSQSCVRFLLKKGPRQDLAICVICSLSVLSCPVLSYPDRLILS